MEDFAYLLLSLSDTEEREICRQMRDLQFRLQVDFFLYQLRDQKRLDLFLANLANGPFADIQIIGQLKEDAPIMFLLLGNRAAARQIWEQQQKNNPLYTPVAHRLALLSYAEAQHYEEVHQQDNLRAAWLQTIANWVRALADDGYWKEWCVTRQHCYGKREVETLSENHKSLVRDKLRQRLAAELRACAERYVQDDGQARMYQDLELLYHIEWRGAQALKEAGGIPLKGNQTLVCGPLLLAQLGNPISQQFGRIVATAQAELERYLSLPPVAALREKTLKASGEVVKNVRLYFSQLAAPAILLEMDRPQGALNRIISLEADAAAFQRPNPSYSGLPDPSGQYEKDLTELAVRAYVAVGRACITTSPPDVEQAAEAWKQSLARAQRGNIEPEAIKWISELAIGRANALRSEQDSDRGELANLTDAIAVLEAAWEVLPPAERTEITESLAAELNRRGVLLENFGNHEGAYEDLRRAFDFYPDSPKYRNNWCSTLIYWAGDYSENGDRRKATDLLERARNLAANWLQNHPDAESLRKTLQWAEEELAILDGKTPGPRDEIDQAVWARLEDAVDRHRKQGEEKVPSVRDRAFNIVLEAENKLEKDNFDSAIASLQEAIKTDPTYSWAKSLLQQTYSRWARELLNNGDIQKAKEKLTLAIEAGLERNETISKLQRDIEDAEDFLNIR